MDHPIVSIFADGWERPTDFERALIEGGMWQALARSADGRAPGRLRIVIKPDLAGLTEGSPLATSPALVEALIDALHDRGFANVAVVGSADSSSLWAHNRDVLSLCELLGYRFITEQGRHYDVLDLGDDSDATVFPPASCLAGQGISRLWVDADFRLVFAKNATDEEAGFALGLDGLIGVLPLADKNLHYRQRRDPGEVVADLLTVAPVGFCLIDAGISAHGAAGRRAPVSIATDTLIACPDIVLADFVAALKMGVDPYMSRIFAGVVRRHPLPRRYTVRGSLDAYAGWENVPYPLLRSTRARKEAVELGRLVEPWLQQIDGELFPFRNALDARLNAGFADFFRDAGTSPTSYALLVLVNFVLGGLGHAVEAYRILLDKDALRQRAVGLGFDAHAVRPESYEALVDELLQLEPIAASAPAATDELRWREVDGAVVFQYQRELPIEFERFVARVDIARTIQFMNDYLGGVIVPIEHDAHGRPIRQAERNIYLPQPNYLALYHGQPIDVTKLEVVAYEPDRHRLFWKTVHSENGSASRDDGIASFERAGEGTCVTIVGSQRFTLPLFWQALDLGLVPDLKARLVTHAYRTFFDRTIANFEALVEGRQIAIGRPVDEPAPSEVDRLMQLASGLAEFALPLSRAWAQSAPAAAVGADMVDADGFVHIRPGRADQAAPSPATPGLEQVLGELGRFIDGLDRARRRDLARMAAGS